MGVALDAVDLGTVVHAAALRPAGLDQPDPVALEADDADRVVLAARPVAVNERAHLGRDRAAAGLPRPSAQNAIEWQPMSIRTPPPERSPSQNQSECGPECSSLCLTR